MDPVLLVEDHEDIMALLRYYFETEGFKVVCVSDVHAGLEICKVQRFVAIVTDHDLKTGKNGIWLIEKIKEQCEGETPPIYLYSSSSEVKKLAVKLGVIGVPKHRVEPKHLPKLLKSNSSISNL